MSATAILSSTLDRSHDAARQSFVAGANGHADFPIQNLPFGVYERSGERRSGVRIGDRILDLAGLLDSGLVPAELVEIASIAAKPPLNSLFDQEASLRTQFRLFLSDVLAETSQQQGIIEDLLCDADAVIMHLPFDIGDYTDFYTGIQHATNIGRLLRPENPLMPNYKYVPIGYHGRVSSIRPSGVSVRRPVGQTRKRGASTPSFGPCDRLDYELELGAWIGKGNVLGQPVAIADALEHIGGFCLLNDWSARDIQAWEYQPLGPFLAKSFASTISPWVITAEALRPFRTAQQARPAGDPKPLPYLCDAQDQKRGALDIDIEVLVTTAAMRKNGLPPHRLSYGSAREMYWTFGQLVAHHTSNGCDLNPGDLLGTGTISGAAPESYGSLMELSAGGSAPISLPGGESRTFLRDGDEVTLRARTSPRSGHVSIGFGDCTASILPALEPTAEVG